MTSWSHSASETEKQISCSRWMAKNARECIGQVEFSKVCFAWVNTLCNLSHKKLQKSQLPVLGQFLSSRWFTLATIFSPRIFFQTLFEVSSWGKKRKKSYSVLYLFGVHSLTDNIKQVFFRSSVLAVELCAIVCMNALALMHWSIRSHDNIFSDRVNLLVLDHLLVHMFCFYDCFPATRNCSQSGHRWKWQHPPWSSCWLWWHDVPQCCHIPVHLVRWCVSGSWSSHDVACTTYQSWGDQHRGTYQC